MMSGAHVGTSGPRQLAGYRGVGSSVSECCPAAVARGAVAAVRMAHSWLMDAAMRDAMHLIDAYRCGGGVPNWREQLRAPARSAPGQAVSVENLGPVAIGQFVRRRAHCACVKMLLACYATASGRPDKSGARYNI